LCCSYSQTWWWWSNGMGLPYMGLFRPFNQKIDSKRYIEEVLQSHLVPFMQGLEQDVEEYAFQQEGQCFNPQKQAYYYYEFFCKFRNKFDEMAWTEPRPQSY